MEGRRSWKYTEPKTRRSRFEWEQLIKEFGESSCSVMEFCSQHDLAVSTFHGWQKRLRSDLNESHEAPPGGFIPVTLSEDEEEQPRDNPWHLRVDDRFDLWIREDFKEGCLKRLLKVLTSC